MAANGVDWWTVIRQVLIEQWEWDEAQLTTPTTVLFSEDIARWMDWVELIQAVTDRVGLPFPRDVGVDRLRTAEDLCIQLERAQDWAPGMTFNSASKNLDHRMS